MFLKNFYNICRPRWRNKQWWHKNYWQHYVICSWKLIIFGYLSSDNWPFKGWRKFLYEPASIDFLLRMQASQQSASQPDHGYLPVGSNMQVTGLPGVDIFLEELLLWNTSQTSVIILSIMKYAKMLKIFKQIDRYRLFKYIFGWTLFSSQVSVYICRQLCILFELI